jgi:UDP-N-acetylmuramate: L-alanyl-gamma-D-glutamyl-meso-diaminopimelate ligase
VAREHIHLIGIGGTGMTALAGLLHDSGCRVTGSDKALYPPTSEILAALGLEVSEGFDAARLRPAPDVVVIGNAISRGNPEAEEALDRNLRYTSMARIVAERFLTERHSIVVAGTHGKTTTTSMLACVLHHAGRDPGFLIGGLPRNFPGPYRLGSGAFVIEGDEYDTAFFDKGPKFMHYRPDTALIGTVEFDHADIYSDVGQIKQAFARLVNIVPSRGLVVRNEDSPISREVTAKALSRVEGYGLESGLWRAEILEETPEGARFRVQLDGEPYLETRIALGGGHNVRNALAVIAAAREQGLERQEIAAGLDAFQGVARRLELRGEVAGVAVLDDFAHHPTAIAETLRAVRRRYPGRRVRAVLEPRCASLRRNVFQERLVECFDDALDVIVAAVFRAADVPEDVRLDPERLVHEISARGPRARYIAGVDEIVRELTDTSRSGDVVVVMSNGGFGGLHARLLEALESRRESA